MIPGAGSERWGHPGNSGHVTTDAEFGKGVTLETGRVIPGTVSAWEWSPWRQQTFSPGTGSGRGFTMETVGMCSQVLHKGRGVTMDIVDVLPQGQGLASVVTLETVDV